MCNGYFRHKGYFRVLNVKERVGYRNAIDGKAVSD